MVSDDEKNVTISYWSNRDDSYEHETMLGEEFVRRFLLNIVPRGVARVRYSGLFIPQGRNARLEVARAAVTIYNHQTSSKRFSKELNENGSLSESAVLTRVDAKPPAEDKRWPKCPHCQARTMRPREYIGPDQTRRNNGYLRSLIAMFSVVITTLDGECQRVLKAQRRVRCEPQTTIDDWLIRSRLESLCEMHSVLATWDDTSLRETQGCDDQYLSSRLGFELTPITLPLPDP